MSETEPKPITLKKYLLIAVISVTISLAYVGVLIVIADSDIQFDPHSIQIGMVDKDYCQYLLANGACLAVSSFDQALPRGLEDTCPYGFTETTEWSTGRICVTNDKPDLIENPLECNWDDCFAIGITKNHDESIPTNYLPPAMKP